MAHKDQMRHSTKKMVALAQELIQKTQAASDRLKQATGVRAPAAADPDPDSEEYKWLIESARSLAGSVISQADPND